MLEVNIKNRAVSQTTRQYNSICNFADKQLAVDSEGIKAVEGFTDSGQGIGAYIKSGKFDLGTERIKRLRFVYFGLEANGHIRLCLFVDDRLAGQLIVPVQGRQEVRVPVSRKFEGRYWQWQVENMGGTFFVLYSVRVLPIPVHTGQR